MRPQVPSRESLFKVVEEMSDDQVAEVLDFARFIQSRTEKKGKVIVKTGSFENFKKLSGIVSLGGDAVVDSENYWD
ncbi:MAG: hypothetical protein O7E52_26060 [Candidatus Poribacteria bacterium]|nr:hypothetical protein [Candidatus Poribacteria bacterium]